MNEAHAMSSPIPDRDTDYDFIISGYGPAGATLANLLGQRGWRPGHDETGRAAIVAVSAGCVATDRGMK